jgi:hypothetical protein
MERWRSLIRGVGDGKNLLACHSRLSPAQHSSLPQKGVLLKFAHDRSRFVSWLGESRKRIGGLILNTAVTSDLVRLPVKDNGDARGIGGL